MQNIEWLSSMKLRATWGISGNNRIDSLCNIVRDPRVSLMFLYPGSGTVMRINGTAQVTADADVLRRFAIHSRIPRSVVIVTIGEVYFQCARALVRANLWSGKDESAGLPTAGDLLAEATSGEIAGPQYDVEWPEHAARTLW